MISWGGVYYAATAHPKQYFCPLSSRHWITHGGGRTPNSVVRNELLQPCLELNSKYRNTKVQLHKVNTKIQIQVQIQTQMQKHCFNSFARRGYLPSREEVKDQSLCRPTDGHRCRISRFPTFCTDTDAKF